MYKLITRLEQFYIHNYWKEQNILAILCEFILLAGNVIWMWQGLKLVPEMENMVLNIETWNIIIPDWELFTRLHIKSLKLAKIGLSLTLVLPWLSIISRIGLDKT